MLHQQHRNPRSVDPRNALKDQVHHRRRKPGRRFIQQQQRRIQHQRPGDRQHLPLPPRKGMRLPLRIPRQIGKQIKHIIDPPPVIILPQKRPHLQVFADTQRRKDIRRLRHIAQPLAHHPLRRRPRNFLPPKPDLPGTRFHQPGQSFHQGRLPAPVGADDRDDFPIVHHNGNAVQDHGFPIPGHHAGGLKQRQLPLPAPPPARAPPNTLQSPADPTALHPASLAKSPPRWPSR